jgi:hypothetical protein
MDLIVEARLNWKVEKALTAWVKAKERDGLSIAPQNVTSQGINPAKAALEHNYPEAVAAVINEANGNPIIRWDKLLGNPMNRAGRTDGGEK